MMRRKRVNRRKQSEGFIFPMPLASILVIAAVLSLCYLWVGGRCEALGKRIKLLEEKQGRVQRERRDKEYNWYKTKSLPNLEKILTRHGLEMTWPDRGRVVQVSAASSGRGEEKPEVRGGEGHLRIAMNE